MKRLAEGYCLSSRVVYGCQEVLRGISLAGVLLRPRAGFILAAVVITSWVALSAQQTDPAIEKVARSYEAAFNNGDAKALAALHTADGVRMLPDGQVLFGRAAIEQAYAAAFAEQLKGATLTIRTTETRKITADVASTSGTYELTGGQTPGQGRYLNTVKQEGGQWLLATVATVDLASGTK